MASADFCRALPPRCRAGSQYSWQRDRSPGISARSFAPLLPDLPRADLGNHGFRHPRPAHPSLVALYPVSVRQVVAVAPASFGPHLAVTPLPSLNGSDSLDRRGLSPPRTGTCPAYMREGQLYRCPSLLTQTDQDLGVVR